MPRCTHLHLFLLYVSVFHIVILRDSHSHKIIGTLVNKESHQIGQHFTSSFFSKVHVQGVEEVGAPVHGKELLWCSYRICLHVSYHSTKLLRKDHQVSSLISHISIQLRAYRNLQALVASPFSSPAVHASGMVKADPSVW